MVGLGLVLGDSARGRAGRAGDTTTQFWSEGTATSPHHGMKLMPGWTGGNECSRGITPAHNNHGSLRAEGGRRAARPVIG